MAKPAKPAEPAKPAAGWMRLIWHRKWTKTEQKQKQQRPKEQPSRVVVYQTQFPGNIKPKLWSAAVATQKQPKFDVCCSSHVASSSSCHIEPCVFSTKLMLSQQISVHRHRWTSKSKAKQSNSNNNNNKAILASS